MKNSEDLIEIHAVVKGRVQGVGFRLTTTSIARQLGLRGTVKNLNDGSVELFILGSQDKINQLFLEVEKIIGKNNIHSIEIKNINSSTHYHDFDIIY